MYTVRGFVREKDGSIHTDSTTKIITVLLYMNERWQEDAGRLRLLRGPDDLEDYVAEVPPYGGTLLVFRRADNSWHGHKPISGPRRAVQLNWVTIAGGGRQRTAPAPVFDKVQKIHAACSCAGSAA